MLDPTNLGRDDDAPLPRPRKSGSQRRTPLPGGVPREGERPGPEGTGAFRMVTGGSFTAGPEEARAGIEPANSGFADRCLTTWLPRHTGQATEGPEGEQGSPGPVRGVTTPPGVPLTVVARTRRRTPPAVVTFSARQQDRVRVALDHVTDAILTADARGCLLTGNAAARTLLALPPDAPLEGRTLDDALAVEAHAVFANAREHAAELGSWTGDLVFRRANGDDCPVSLTLLAQHTPDGALEGWSLVARELASPIRQRALESQARRYEGVGRLASGVAHDFQNLLAATLATSEHLLERFSVGSAERGDIEAIRSATERSSRLVKQLLGYARRAFDAPRAADMNQAVRQVEDLVARLVTQSVTVEFDLAPVLPLVPVDRAALEQLLLTLAVVARDALPTGGVITFRTDEVVHTPNDPARAVAAPGRYVALTVSARRAAEPQPRARRPREDVGLALASVTAIVALAGGYLWGDTLPGREATYTLWIPRADDEASTALPP